MSEQSSVFSGHPQLNGRSTAVNYHKRIPLTLTEDKALNRMRTGSTLIHTSPRPDKPRDYQWFVVPGGPVKPEVADRIKAHPAVVGQADGLWPGHDQTWRMRSFVSKAPAP
jgi:hypothetical protein